MEAPRILISDITPKSGKKLSAFDKHSKEIKAEIENEYQTEMMEDQEYY